MLMTEADLQASEDLRIAQDNLSDSVTAVTRALGQTTMVWLSAPAALGRAPEGSHSRARQQSAALAAPGEEVVSAGQACAEVLPGGQ